MPLLSGATKIYLGGTPVNKVYVGATQVWAPSGPSADPATEAWVAAVVAAGGTVSAGRKTLVDNLIVGLKADSVWTKLDRLYLLAAENTKSALIDLIALAQATATSAPTFAVDVGYTVDGTKIVDFNYNPGVGTWHFTQDNAHYGAWNLMGGTMNYPLITDNPITSRMLYSKYPNDQIYTRLQDAWNGLPIGDPRGWLVGNRINSDGRDTYQNGSLFGNMYTGGSSAVTNAPTILYVGGPCSAASFGGSLTAIEHLALYNRLYAYMYALGIVDEADPQIWAWKQAVIGTGGSISSGRLTLVRNLIAGLKADGVWAKLDRLFILAAENEQSALVPLTGGGIGKNVSSAVFTVDRGYSFAGGGYVDLVYVPSTNGVRLTLNSAHLSAWNLMEGGTSYGIVQTGGAGLFAIFPAHYYDGQNYMRINDTLSGPNPTIGPDHKGLLLGNRTGASVTEAYQNGILKNTQSTASESVTTGGLVAADNQCAMTSVGGSFTATEQLAFYNRLRTYMTAVGVP